METSPENAVATAKLREKIREHTKKIRNSQRNNENDSLRLGLGDIHKMIKELDNITEKDVTGLCQRIKRKKHAKKDDLYRLSNAFLQSQENITTFIKIQGAIQVLVKELTGNDSEQQIRASETLCNLSLGGTLVCEKISLAAGSYFVTYLSSTEIRLKQTSLWVLINIIATGDKGLNNLMQMELISKLFSLYLSQNENPEIIKDAALALDLILTSVEILGSENQKFHCDNMHIIKPGQSGCEFHLKLIFSASIISPEFSLSDNQLKYLIEFSISNILNTSDFVAEDNILKIIYSVRVLSNLFSLYSEKIWEILNNSILVYNIRLIDLLNHIFSFNDKILTNECFLLVKNIIVCENFKGKAQNLIQELKVKRNFIMC